MGTSVAAARKLELVFCHCVAKSLVYPNEDCFAYDEDRQIFVISDGASVSYDSALWSKILTTRFVDYPDIDDKWLGLARQEFLSFHDLAEISWNKQAAFERGSFATILGLSYDPDLGKAHVLGVGDSVIVMIDDKDGWITSFPYEKVSDFRQDPILISSHSDTLFEREGTIKPLPLSEHTGTVTLLLMTDALGAWCLEHQYEGAVRLTTMIDNVDFRQFLQAEQQAGRMRIDDATLMVLKLGGAL